MRTSRAAKGGKPAKNRLLVSIPEDEFLALREDLEAVDMPQRLCLHEPHQPVDFQYFPNEGVISLVVELKDGKTVEAGLVGNEGVAGMPAILGLSRNPLREVVQIA